MPRREHFIWRLFEKLIMMRTRDNVWFNLIVLMKMMLWLFDTASYWSNVNKDALLVVKRSQHLMREKRWTSFFLGTFIGLLGKLLTKPFIPVPNFKNSNSVIKFSLTQCYNGCHDEWTAWRSNRRFCGITMNSKLQLCIGGLGHFSDCAD